MVGGIPSTTVMSRSGAADMPLPAISVTAPAPMSSCGAAIPLTTWRWASESIRVIIVAESASRVLEVTASRTRPPEDRPASRTAMRS